MSSGLDERDAAFMERLRNLAHEALTWPHLGEKQRLVWAAVLELDAVPLQEPATCHTQTLNITYPYPIYRYTVDSTHICHCADESLKMFRVYPAVAKCCEVLPEPDGRSFLPGFGSARTSHVDIQARKRW